MKLRIHGDSLRVRVTHAEVLELDARGIVEARVRLTDERALGYRLTVAPQVTRIGVGFTGDVIDIRLPEDAAREWCRSDRVSLRDTHSAGGKELRIVVEKDFDSHDG
jgi:hypothetical protein